LNDTLKKSFTSSVVIHANTRLTLCSTVLAYASSLNASSKTSWIQGQHGQLCVDEVQPLEQGSWRQFWHEGTFFMLSTNGTLMIDNSPWGYPNDDDNGDNYASGDGSLELSCFGPSDAPILKLIDYCKTKVKDSGM
jgi:hypothetical protein